MRRYFLLSAFFVIFLSPWVHSDELTIGAFNLRVFGDKKANNESLLSLYIEIIRGYDVIFLQEIKDKDGSAQRALLNKLNEGSTQKHFVMIQSERLPKHSVHNKEQYVFLYRQDRLKPLKRKLYSDPLDIYRREPMMVQFQSLATNLSFVLVGLHARYDKQATFEEIRALEQVYAEAQKFFDEDDFLFLGDFNADGAALSKKQEDKLFIEMEDPFLKLIERGGNTTVKENNYAYDRFFTNASMDNKISSLFIQYFDQQFGLEEEEAFTVSDHYPIGVIVRDKNELKDPF